MIARISPVKDRFFRFPEGGRVFHRLFIITRQEGIIEVEYHLRTFQNGLIDLQPELGEGIALLHGIAVIIVCQKEAVFQKTRLPCRGLVFHLSVGVQKGLQPVKVLVQLSAAQGEIVPEDPVLLTLPGQGLHGGPQKALLGLPASGKDRHIVCGGIIEAIALPVQGRIRALSRHGLVEDLLLLGKDGGIRQDPPEDGKAALLGFPALFKAAFCQVQAGQADHLLVRSQKPFYGLLQGPVLLHFQKVDDMVPGVLVLQTQVPLQGPVIRPGQRQAL